jgi:hypothetical protein
MVISSSHGTDILHEFLADRTNVFAQRRTEHHHLLFMRGRSEDFLHITSHIWNTRGLGLDAGDQDKFRIPQPLTKLFQHLVTLVQYKVLNLAQVQRFVLHKSQHTSRSSNNEMRAIILEHVVILLNQGSTIDD